MKWIELKRLITEEYNRRNLASDVRYRSLDRIEDFLRQSPQLMNNVELLLQVDKKALKEAYRQFRGTENISGADNSCFNEIYNQLINKYDK